MKCMFNIKKNTKKIIWEITNQCNYNCSYCIFSSNFKKNINELSTDECINVIDQLALMDYKNIKITGGEPFIREDIVKLLKYCCKKDLIVDISTNASLITNEIVEELRLLKLKMIHISLDGAEKTTHELVRGVNTFDRTVAGIIKLKSSNQYIRIGTVLNSFNENCILDIINFCKNLEVNEIIFSIMEPAGKLDGNKTNYITKTLSELTQEIMLYQKETKDIIINYNWREIKDNTLKCPAGESFIYINNLGNISPCTWLVTKNNDFVSKQSLKDTKLEDVLKEESFDKCNLLKKEHKGECIADVYGKY